jgi:triacylglycerol lipase
MSRKVPSSVIATALAAGVLLTTATAASGAPVSTVPISMAHAAAVPGGPVILVHGWTGSSAGMAVMRDAFAAAGYPTFTIDLPGQNNVTNAHAIANFVHTVKHQTSATRVHLVTHSMGGLSARYYLKRLGGVGEVSTFVSMGAPQYGSLPACLLSERDGGQMCPFSGFLRDLNTGDDTPGEVGYFTFRSTKDTADVTRLDGGACFHEISGVEHADEPRSPQFIQAALAAVSGSCPGSFVNLPVE